MELKLQADDCVWKQRKQSNNLEAPLGAGNRLSQNNSAYRRLLCLRYYFSPLDVLFWRKSASLWVFWREGLVWGRSSRSFVCNHKTKKLPIRFYCVPRYLVMGDCSELGVTHWISQKCSRMTATGIVSNYCVQRRYILPRCRTNRLKYSFVPAATGLLNRCFIDESVCSFQCCLLCCMLLLLCDCGWLFCVTAWG